MLEIPLSHIITKIVMGNDFNKLQINLYVSLLSMWKILFIYFSVSIFDKICGED